MGVAGKGKNVRKGTKGFVSTEPETSGKTNVPSPSVSPAITEPIKINTVESSKLQAQHDLIKSIIVGEKEILLIQDPKEFAKEYNKRWREQSPTPHTLEFNDFTIQGLKRCWSLYFNTESDLNLYLGIKDDGETFAVFGYGIHNVISHNPIILALKLNGNNSIELTKEAIAWEFSNLDETGRDDDRDERFQIYWDYVSKDLGIA